MIFNINKALTRSGILRVFESNSLSLGPIQDHSSSKSKLKSRLIQYRINKYNKSTCYIDRLIELF